jgi:hypothetical protein
MIIYCCVKQKCFPQTRSPGPLTSLPWRRTVADTLFGAPGPSPGQNRQAAELASFMWNGSLRVVPLDLLEMGLSAQLPGSVLLPQRTKTLPHDHQNALCLRPECPVTCTVGLCSHCLPRSPGRKGTEQRPSPSLTPCLCSGDLPCWPLPLLPFWGGCLHGLPVSWVLLQEFCSYVPNSVTASRPGRWLRGRPDLHPAQVATSGTLMPWSENKEAQWGWRAGLGYLGSGCR